MNITRRTFLKTTTVAAGATLLTPPNIFGKYFKNDDKCFGVHSFIENHPEAVFIMKTNIDVKTNAAAIKKAGLDFGDSVFINRTAAEGGTPVSTKIALKPNITCRYATTTPGYTTLGTMGIVTDSNFVEGIIESLKTVGVAKNNFYIRETNCPSDFEEGGYISMAARTGANIKDLSGTVDTLDAADVQWVDINNGIWFKKLPFLAPVNSPDSYLINIAKLKTHTMGMTLCAKNLQGSIAHNYQEHCRIFSSDMDVSADHVHSDAREVITANYNRHLEQKIPRWDRPGDNGGLWMETWCSRCLDTNSVTKAGLHIIEGIYGRDGNFSVGPAADGTATDYMCNYIIFGKNQFLVDNIGIWLGGHEPGNFGLFHLAVERGFTTTFNPANIPVYEWKSDGSATLTPLTNFTRAALKTKYLQRDYNGQTEELWHMVNESYDYPTSVNEQKLLRPDTFVLRQNYPNPFNPSTSIEFYIPQSGNVKIEVYDVTGRVVYVAADGYYSAGSHLANWKNANNSSGVYFYRMLFNGYSKTKSMMLLK
jgi:hypothetical protein